MNFDRRINGIDCRIRRWLAVGVVMWSCGPMQALAQESAVDTLSPSSPVTVVAQGNTLLPSSTLAEILAPLPAPVSLDVIRATANRLQEAYRRAGFGAVVVNLPAQTVSDGVIRLEIVEGKLDQIYLQSNQFHADDNILHSLPALKKNETPNLIAIDANALQANENPSKASRVTFQPGQSVGLVDALVVTRDRDPLQYTLGVDNTGNDATGNYRASVAVQHADLFGRDHVLSGRGEISPTQGAHSNAASLSYSLPVYEFLSSVEIIASYSDVESKNIATAAGDALFAGEGSSVGVRYRRYLPKVGRIRQRVQFGMDLRRYQNDCSVGIFGSAGCGSASADVDVRPVTLSYDARSDLFTANLQFSQNLAGGGHGQQDDFELARPGAKARYRVARGSLSAAHRFRNGSALSLRNSFQYTRNALVSSEQLGLGGVDTVRAYEQRELIGDKGVISTLELASPPLALPGRTALAQLINAVVFGDWGRVSNNRGTFCDADDSACRISSAGLGLRWNYRDRIFALADVARAFNTGPQTKDGDYKLHFSLGYGF